MDTVSYAPRAFVAAETGVNVRLGNMVLASGVSTLTGTAVTTSAGDTYIVLKADGSFEAVAGFSGLTEGEFVALARLNGARTGFDWQRQFDGKNMFTSTSTTHP